ncbi:MAG: hypothetical protein U9Q33_06925 [Campylobacterota bacterium]|nr:hypothetical protein [Campylobacterota bacterium]
MRIYIVIFISLLAFLVIIAGNYFNSKIPKYKKDTKFVQSAMKTAYPIRDTNKWIRSYIVPYVESLETIDEAENSLVKDQENMQKEFEMLIDEMDKTPNGYIKISASAKVFRNDVENMLKLFKNDIHNGYIKINEVWIDPTYINIRFEIIKFYKEKP